MTSIRIPIAVVATLVLAWAHPAGASEDSGGGWVRGLAFARELEEQARVYEVERPRFRRTEIVTSARFREGETAASTIARLPGGEEFPDFRTPSASPTRSRSGVPRRLRALPSADAWAMLFSSRNEPFFMYRDLGTRLDGYELIREIRFRGALPFAGGRDVREWEGVALVEPGSGRVIEIRARPRDQNARLRKRFERWSRAFKFTVGVFSGPFLVPGVTFRLARRPLAYRCFVRLDDRREGLRLPSVLSYEIRQAVSLERTELRRRCTRRYADTTVIGTPRSGGSTPRGARVRESRPTARSN